MKYDSKPCKLLSARQLTGDVFDFVLEAPALAAMAQPGQFAQILVPGHTLRRPISRISTTSASTGPTPTMARPVQNKKIPAVSTMK